MSARQTAIGSAPKSDGRHKLSGRLPVEFRGGLAALRAATWMFCLVAMTAIGLGCLAAFHTASPAVVFPLVFVVAVVSGRNVAKTIASARAAERLLEGHLAGHRPPNV